MKEEEEEEERVDARVSGGALALLLQIRENRTVAFHVFRMYL